MGDTRGNVTRRRLLGGVAAAGAASLVRSPVGFARAEQPGRRISSLSVGSLRGESPPLRAPQTFELAGVQWSGPAEAAIELRARAPAGSWSPWVTASVLGHDGDGRVARTEVFGEPVWTGPADGVQLRADRPVQGVRVHFVDPGDGGAHSASFALAQPVLDAGPGQPPIIARGAWAQGQAHPQHPPEYGTVKLAFVHHTVNPNGYSAGAVPSMLRAIFDYHVFVRGFFDIAYNYVIDLYGRIWEGRVGGIDMPVIGAQAGGYNTESTGVAVLGDFMDVVPSQAAISSLQHLLAWKLSLHGLPALGYTTVIVDPYDAFYTPFAPGAHVSLPRVAGHRQGDSTDCPGDAFFARLPAIRPRVAALAGTPARLRIRPQVSAATAGAPVTIAGFLETLDGAPLADAPIELQQAPLGITGVGAPTVATGTTASDGTWSVQLSWERNVMVRALHSAFPAAVADWMFVTVVPTLTLALESSTPLTAGGTVSPPKRLVIVELHSAGHLGGKPVRHKRVSGADGTFTASLREPPPGDYVLIARTPADAVNGAGASVPVPITIS
jgi:hypothetical protein